MVRILELPLFAIKTVVFVSFISKGGYLKTNDSLLYYCEAARALGHIDLLI